MQYEYDIEQTGDWKEEIQQLGTNNVRNVNQKVTRITTEILSMRGLNTYGAFFLIWKQTQSGSNWGRQHLCSTVKNKSLLLSRKVKSTNESSSRSVLPAVC